MILSTTANVTLGENKIAEQNKSNLFHASSWHDVVGEDRRMAETVEEELRASDRKWGGGGVMKANRGVQGWVRGGGQRAWVWGGGLQVCVLYRHALGDKPRVKL